MQPRCYAPSAKTSPATGNQPKIVVCLESDSSCRLNSRRGPFGCWLLASRPLGCRQRASALAKESEGGCLLRLCLPAWR